MKKWSEMSGKRDAVFVILMFAAAAFGVSLLAWVKPLGMRLRLSGELADVALEAQRQEVLFPFYQMLREMDRLEDWAGLVRKERQPLNMLDVLRVPELVADLVSPHGFVSGNADLRIRENAAGVRVLHVEVPLRGSYEKLGALLVDALRLPSLSGIIRIKVDDDVGIQSVILGMDLALAVDQTESGR